MTVKENKYGVSLGGNESKKKPGTYYLDGAARVIQSALADGMTNVSIWVSDYGPMLQFSKPIEREERAE